MKFSFFSLFLFLSLTACGKSATSAGVEEALSLNGSPYTGRFQNDAGTDSGDIRFTFVDDGLGGLTGIVSISDSVCLESGQVFGTVTEDGAVIIQVIQTAGALNIAGNATNSSFTGSYSVNVTEGSCSSTTGSGTFSASR